MAFSIQKQEQNLGRGPARQKKLSLICFRFKNKTLGHKCFITVIKLRVSESFKLKKKKKIPLIQSEDRDYSTTDEKPKLKR